MIAPETIKEIANQIVAHFDPSQIVLFGSYATGKATFDSDIDLLVVMDTHLPERDRYPAVRRVLAGYPVAFDLIIKTPEEYRRTRNLTNHIVYFAEKYGKRIYVRGNTRLGATVDC